MNLGIIPARGGSKRIPRKNIRNFCGKPMLVWSIEALQTSKSVDRIIVSTEDPEIAKIALENGAEVPFIRPLNISDDTADTWSVINHAVRWIKNNEGSLSVKNICCLYATAPLVSIENLRLGLDLINSAKWDYVVPVTPFDYPIQRALVIDESGFLGPHSKDNITSRSQDLVRTYHDAGQFYWGTFNAWLTKKSIFESNTRALLLPKYSSVDIDDEEDWEFTETLFNCKYSK